MAHFMPNLCEKVLDCLYQCFGKKEYRILGWGNITKGYGLKPVEFDRFQDCSRSIFYKCRNQLLNQKLIDIIKTDKTKRTGHKPRCVITLLGIIKLFQTKPIGTREFNEIMEVLAENYIDDNTQTIFHSDHVDYEEMDDDSYLGLWYRLVDKKKPSDTSEAILKMFEGIKPQILCDVLFEVLKGIEIIAMNGSVESSFSLNISKYNKVTLWKFKLENDTINCIWSPQPPEWREWDDDLTGDDWTLQEFYFHVVEYILESMWYTLSKYHFRELPKYLVEGKTEQDKIQHSGPIDYFMDMLNGMVFDMTSKM